LALYFSFLNTFWLFTGADKVMAAVLSNDVQIGLSGSEATIYVYNG